MKISVPGKVLISGGYLILDRPHYGWVVTTTAQMHVRITTRPKSSSSTALKIDIHSVQFQQQWHYTLQFNQDYLVLQNDQDSDNVYVQRAVEYAMTYIYAEDKERIKYFAEKYDLILYIEADNDFYSQRSQLEKRGWKNTRANLNALPDFLPLDLTENGLAKTGLGSSAALMTALVGALCAQFEVIDVQAWQQGEAKEADQDIVHRLSQCCHSAAQGKIGSGFDVSSGVFGSQQYIRFSPSVMTTVLQENPLTCAALQRCVHNEAWDDQHHGMNLPYPMQLVLADINGGSSTVSMVRKVMAWRENGGSVAADTWKALGKVNHEFQEQIKTLVSLTMDEMQVLSTTSALEWPKGAQPLLDIRTTFMKMRHLLRTIGKMSEVEIEPPESTRLADATMNVPGVLLSGVPGAGGFDAIFAIVVHSDAIAEVERLWENWNTQSSLTVCPLTLSAAPPQHNALSIIP